MSLEEHVARAIYDAAYEGKPERVKPEPGWSWERTSDEMRQFALRQATAAINAMRTWKR